MFRKYWWLLGIAFIAAATYLVFLINQSSDFPDLVYYNGNYYVTTDMITGDKLTKNDLGERLGNIHSRVGEKITSPNYSPHDWDASRLKKGTPFYSLPGHSEAFRVAAVVGGKVIIYQNYLVPWEELSDKVDTIEIYSLDDSLLATIDHQADIATLVTLVANAHRDIPMDVILDSQLTPANQKKSFLLRFVLHDGTSLVSFYDSDKNSIAGNVIPTDELSRIISEIIE